jgi:hypothetical protein
LDKKSDLSINEIDKLAAGLVDLPTDFGTGFLPPPPGMFDNNDSALMPPPPGMFPDEPKKEEKKKDVPPAKLNKDGIPILEKEVVDVDAAKANLGIFGAFTNAPKVEQEAYKPSPSDYESEDDSKSNYSDE